MVVRREAVPCFTWHSIHVRTETDLRESSFAMWFFLSCQSDLHLEQEPSTSLSLFTLYSLPLTVVPCYVQKGCHQHGGLLAEAGVQEHQRV